MKSESKPRQPRHWTTDKQGAAARRNGKKSQGPVTAIGKSVSSANATTHGASSQLPDLATLPGYYTQFRAYLEEYNIVNPNHLDTIEDLVGAAFRRHILTHSAESMWAQITDSEPDQKRILDVELAECRQIRRFQRSLSRLHKIGKTNPSTTHLQPIQQHPTHPPPQNLEFFHNLTSITKSYD